MNRRGNYKASRISSGSYSLVPKCEILKTLMASKIQKKKKKLCSCQAHKYMLLFPTDRASRRCLQGSEHICAGEAEVLGCPGKELTLMWAPWCAHALPFFAENSEMATRRESRLRFWMCSSSSPSGLVVEKFHVLGGRKCFQATIACWRVSLLPATLPFWSSRICVLSSYQAVTIKTKGIWEMTKSLMPRMKVAWRRWWHQPVKRLYFLSEKIRLFDLKYFS